jgi:hypothetical protein
MRAKSGKQKKTPVPGATGTMPADAKMLFNSANGHPSLDYIANSPPRFSPRGDITGCPTDGTFPPFKPPNDVGAPFDFLKRLK